jgi:hypothetical protein
MVDWDCAEALSLPDMIKALTYIHEHGTFPVRTLFPFYPSIRTHHLSSPSSTPKKTKTTSVRAPSPNP